MLVIPLVETVPIDRYILDHPEMWMLMKYTTAILAVILAMLLFRVLFLVVESEIKLLWILLFTIGATAFAWFCAFSFEWFWIWY